MIREIAREIFFLRRARADSDSASYSTRRGVGRPRRSPRARAEQSRRGAMSSAAASARGHATCPCCQVCLRAPPTSWWFKRFPGKNETADVSVSLGTLPRSPATGRRAPTSLGVTPVPPRPRTRGRARNPRDRRRCPPPSPPPVADRAPLDPRRALFFFAAYRKSLTKLTFQTRSKRASLPVPGADTPIRRAEPRPPAGVRAMHRDRAPRAPVDARAAPRRARARARRRGERAEPERRGEKKESYCAFRRRATAVATAVRSPQSGLRLR